MAEKKYIDAEALNSAICEAVHKYPSTFYNGLETARKIAHDFPAADVKPVVRGRWIKVRSHDGGVWKSIACSNCKYEPWFSSAEPLYHYCPNCGAWMGDRENEKA